MSSTIGEFLGFDPSTTEASESFKSGQQDTIPNGRYQAIATSAVRKHTKSGNGWFWEIIFAVAEGQYEGCTVVHRFNMTNPSEEAVAIGRSHMKRYLDSIGNLNPQDESEMCNITVWIEIECKKSTYTNRRGEKAEGINSEIVKIDSYSSTPLVQKTGTEPSKTAPWKR